MKTPIRLLMIAGLATLALATELNAQSASPSLTLGEDAPDPTPASTLDLGPARTPAPTKNTAAKKPASGAAGKSQQFGSWEVGCPEGEPVCVMAQIGNDKSGTPILEMHLRKLPEPQSVQGVTVIALVDIITPLGAVLTSGLTMQIDSGDIQKAPFQICTEQGCLVREPLTEEAVNRFKRGNNATLTVVAAQQGELQTVISLSGFTKAYNSL